MVNGAASFQHPPDTALSPEGSTTYFVATAAGGPAVFLDGAGSRAVTTLAEGSPLGSPPGIAVGHGPKTGGAVWRRFGDPGLGPAARTE
ncbi:MAG: hypothetical protein ACRDZ8_01145 [Acidimicrobiales bacterium]